MEKSELTIFVNHVCEMQRQQFNSIQELTLCLVALQRVLEDHAIPNVQQELRAKIQDLRRGELAQQFAQNMTAFERALSLAKASLL
jgi:hypothetical protein